MPMNQEKQGLGGRVPDLITEAYSFLELKKFEFHSAIDLSIFHITI